MKIQFIKDCPCNIDGVIRQFKSGDYFEASEKDASWMLRFAYAIECKIETSAKAIEPAENKMVEPIENKSLKPKAKTRAKRVKS